MTWEEACRIFKLPVTASDAEIEARLKLLKWTLHPDTNQNKPEWVIKQLEGELKQVFQAYDILKDSINNPYKTPPKLDVTPKYIRFKDVEIGQKKTAVFTIKSVGGTYTKIWIDDAPSQWLHVTNLKSLTNEELPLDVSIEATGIGQSGRLYECNLLVKLENEQTKLKDEVTVKIELALKAKPAILMVDETMIEIKCDQLGQTEMRTFELSNIGHSMLQAHLYTTKTWLSVSPNFADINPLRKSTHTLTVKTDSLPNGCNDTDFISINTNGGNATIRVDSLFAPRTSHGETPKPATPSVPAMTRQAFSLHRFRDTLLIFVILPIMPLIVLIPIAIVGNLWDKSWIIWIILAAYGLVALGVSIGKGLQGEKQKISISAPWSAPPHISTAGTPVASVIGNRFSLVYHKPGCMWAKRISASRYNSSVSLTVEEAKRRGYKRCKVCQP